MNRTSDRVYAWCGPAMVVLLLAGFLAAGWLPPPSPHQSAAQVADDYRTHTTGIRVGMLLVMGGAALLGPWSALIASRLRRAGSRASAYCQLILGGLLVIEFIIPVMIFEVAAFRPGRSPELLLALSDLGWIMLVGTVSTAVVELVLLGVAVRGDRGPVPVFPPWFGTLSVAVGVIFALGGLVVFAKSGPFAWNGLLAFWVPLAVYGGWIFVATALLLRAPLDSPSGVTTVDQLAAEVAALRSTVRDLTGVPGR